MTKIIIFIALICMTSASFRNSGPNRRSASFRRPNSGVQWSSKLCENENLTRSIITKVRQFITTLETNGSFIDVLQKHNQAIVYIKSDANADVLSSNCTEYFNGLNNARKLDEKAEEQQQKYEQNAYNQLKQILLSVIAPGSSFYENFLK